MRHVRVVFILGDVHGDFGRLNGFINTRIRLNNSLCAIAARWKAERDDFRVLLLQAGDFAYYWPLCDSRGAIRNRVDYLPGGHLPVYWVGGNHEDWDRLDTLGPGITEIDRGIHYCAFGSTLQLSPEITVLFAGGAESADIAERLRAMKAGSPKIWWDQEGICEVDMERLAAVPRADWVVSHTCPKAFDIASQMHGLWGAGGHFFEPSRGKLEEVFLNYRPKKWFFGHFHHHMTGRTDGCSWAGLNYLGSGQKCWEKIYLEWEDEAQPAP